MISNLRRVVIALGHFFISHSNRKQFNLYRDSTAEKFFELNLLNRKNEKLSFRRRSVRES
jgi:hypothetical protein